MITCIFGLTACGNEETTKASTEERMAQAEERTTQFWIPALEIYFDDATADEFLAEYGVEEIEYIFAQQSLFVEGNGILTAISSFNSAYDTIGNIVEVKDATSVLKDDEIIVTVDVVGENKNATVEAIFEDNMFLRAKSITINPVATMGDMMEKAALNTLIGMGTVFAVLLLIMVIIYGFQIIPKIQNAFNKKKENKDVKETAVDNTVAQIAQKEELADDLELVAVISAAIAASEGAASTDGFVVRSILRRAR